MNIKNKLLISFILFISILSIFSFSFATSIPNIDVVYNGETYTLTDYPESMQDFDYLAIFPQSLNSSTGEYFDYVLWGFEYVDIVGRNTMKGTRTVFSLDGSQAGRGWSTPYTASDFVAFKADSVPPVWINFDMLDQEGNVVFPQAPVNQVTIPAIQQVGEIPQVMGQVMEILIPVGLIVFSIGLVIYLTRLVISRVQ